MATKQQMREYALTEERFMTDVPHISAGHMRTLLDHLHRYETTLHRIAENDCNGHPRIKTEVRDGKVYQFEVEDEEWARRDAKKEKSIQDKVQGCLVWLILMSNTNTKNQKILSHHSSR
jgi:hypothetical protein